VQGCVTPSCCEAERQAAKLVTSVARERSQKRLAGKEIAPSTRSVDTGYQAKGLIEKLRELKTVPHIAEYENANEEELAFVLRKGKRNGWRR